MEHKCLAKKKASSEIVVAVSREAAINEYLKSPQFENDFGELIAPSFQMGFTTAID